jgi:hypothetical protein
MAVVRLRHIDPQGAMYVHALGREVAAGEVFEVEEKDAGAAVSGSVEAGDYDPGHGLLGQLGSNYELVTDPPSKTPATKSDDTATTVNEG